MYLLRLLVLGHYLLRQDSGRLLRHVKEFWMGSRCEKGVGGGRNAIEVLKAGSSTTAVVVVKMQEAAARRTCAYISRVN